MNKFISACFVAVLLISASFLAMAAPVVNMVTGPSSSSTYTAPVDISLLAQSLETGGSITKVEFYQGSVLIGVGTALSGGYYYLGWSHVAPGNYSVTAKATDNLGAVTTSSPLTFTVNPPVNVPPTVSLTAPANGSSYIAPASVAMSATAADSDGTVTKVEFYQGAVLLGTATTAPYGYTWANVLVGSYSLHAKAYDNLGAVTDSAAVSVTVNAGVAHGVYYVYADHLNTPRVITDSANKVVWRWDSDPFGSDAANEDPDGDGVKFGYNLRFPGQYYDKETGLHYNYFRDYDPSTGRYVESDPMGLEGGINTYSYVRNNPLSKVDPFGLFEEEPGLEGVYPELYLLGGGILKKAAAECKNLRCKAKKEGPHHFFEGYGWCEHYRITCFRKGQPGSTFVSAQIRVPGGKCFPLKHNGGQPY